MSYAALTFDCYGTLVDWRSGLLEGVGACPALAGASWDRGLFLVQRLSAEAELEAGGWRPYREIVATSIIQALARQGVTLPPAEAATVAAGIGDWPLFADTAAALEILGRHRRLVIVSNVDGIDIAATLRRLPVSFSHVVTAEDVRSYKPAAAHFHEALARLALPGAEILHVAQSLFHDIRPVASLGLDTAWVNRGDERLPEDVQPVLQVPDMASLAATLGPGTSPGQS